MSLYPFQKEGADFLLPDVEEPLRDQAAYLGDRMGLGKTVQAATAAKVMEPRRVVVVAKASAIENWKREWRIWGPVRKHQVDFVSWATVHKYDKPLDLVILDEAHYAKNHGARRTQAALKLARLASRAFLLSGTPMPNHPGELWAPISVLWPEIPEELGISSYHHWVHRFCQTQQTKFGLKVWGLKDVEELKPYLQRILLRRTVAMVGVQLPPARLDLHRLPADATLDKAAAGLGLDVEKLKGRMVHEQISEFGSNARLRRLIGEHKAPLIGQLIAEELEEGEYGKIVVLAYHRSVMDLLRQALEPFGVVGFDGSTPQSKRQEAIDEFTRGRARVFLGQSTAAGDSINLQVASEIVLVEPSWSPADNAQAIKRVHRIGSENPVRARMFAVAGSMDESVIDTITRKTKMALEVEL